MQKFVFRGEIALSYINPHYAYQIARVDGAMANTTYTFNQYNAAATPQILFNFYNKDNFKLYIDAGIAFNFSSYTNNKFVIDESDIAGPYLAPFWINLPLQTGMILNKKIEVCFTYINKASFSRSSSFDSSNQTVSVGVKLLFGKN